MIGLSRRRGGARCSLLLRGRDPIQLGIHAVGLDLAVFTGLEVDGRNLVWRIDAEQDLGEVPAAPGADAVVVELLVRIVLPERRVLRLNLLEFRRGVVDGLARFALRRTSLGPDPELALSTFPLVLGLDAPLDWSAHLDDRLDELCLEGELVVDGVALVGDEVWVHVPRDREHHDGMAGAWLTAQMRANGDSGT